MEGSKSGWSQCKPESMGVAILAAAVSSMLAPRERRREGACTGGGEIGWEEREETTFSRKKLLQFPRHIPLCKWLGRGLFTGPSSLGIPPDTDTRRKWKSKRNR